MLKALQGVLSIFALMSVVAVVFLDMQGFVYAAIAFAAAAVVVQLVSIKNKKSDAAER
ncbi:hypothetical protein [Alkalicoccus daliensis]|uniref:Uncharacterized protein n=1 Tax=Alkalicoccus daliensis TaxID=745820 RepID=A0A1H0I193_9BACI|nr:hypothetical protein [Alkalicoccus daliensis]SDO25175.1 hypothetical protein SAMN04488053_109132 [Alkalicoccus daliensis]